MNAGLKKQRSAGKFIAKKHYNIYDYAWHFHGRYRHVWLVKAHYYFDGRRYETPSKIDRRNMVSENDTVTIIYSTQNSYLSTIKKLID